MQDSADEQPHVEHSSRASKLPTTAGFASARLAKKVMSAMVIFISKQGSEPLSEA